MGGTDGYHLGIVCYMGASSAVSPALLNSEFKHSLSFGVRTNTALLLQTRLLSVLSLLDAQFAHELLSLGHVRTHVLNM